MHKLVIVILLLLAAEGVVSQHRLKGTVADLANKRVKLVGYEGLATYPVDSVMVSSTGEFELNFKSSDTGMGYLIAENSKPYLVVLTGEGLVLKGKTLADPATIIIVEGIDNQIFEHYAIERRRRAQGLSGRSQSGDSLLLAKLGPERYMSSYLPLRQLISSITENRQNRSQTLQEILDRFRTIDFVDHRLYKSGLLADLIESHFWLLENSGFPFDTVVIEINRSIDHFVGTLLKDENKLNELSSFLFNYLESRSLFSSSEYLALKLLNETSCTLHSNFAAQLESYRALKVGNTAPDLVFEGDRFMPGYSGANMPRQLSDIRSSYCVVVFGAGWCSRCREELAAIAAHYPDWKQSGVEVIFISLDTDKSQFSNFASGFPFISVCDYKQWDSPLALQYYIFATPTLYLLDSNQKIRLRPHSVQQLDAWVEYYLQKE